MNDLPLKNEAARTAGPAFVSYATTDRKEALSVCKALEKRGVRCWISCRDVAPGENYQEAIVRAIRGAGAVVLVFSKAANVSDEIKKELSLASRYRVRVFALRIDDVEPSDAFAYELSTRQWIDTFAGREKALDTLAAQVKQTSASPGPVALPRPIDTGRPLGMAALVSLLLLVSAAAAWLWLRPSSTAAHNMTVRLAGFELLSANLPPSMHQTVNSEITAAFNADGVIGVSAATAPPPGMAPAYALGGTIERVGEMIRVITRLTNERSGAVLWSDSQDYAADQLPKVARWVGVEAGTVVRCGLFGASTYRKPLSDAVLKDYMLYCQHYWSYDGDKTLVSAQRVVAAVPDFSWGWSGVANGYMQVAASASDGQGVDAARAEGRKAADRAISLDPKNSEALSHKTLLIDPSDWLGKEALLKRAVAAAPLDCDCEHYLYAGTLQSVGRIDDAIEQYRHATDRMALWYVSKLDLAEALVAAGRLDEARTHFDAAAELTPDPNFSTWVAIREGIETGNYAAAIKALEVPASQMSPTSRAALLAGYRALAKGNSEAKAAAVRKLAALPREEQSRSVAKLLAALGAPREALQVASIIASKAVHGPKIFWEPSMRSVLNEPAFPAVVQQLGLITYWKGSRTKPDVCAAKVAPPFCRMI